MFTKIDNEPAYRKVSSLIEQQIMERILQPGDTLPSETAMAEQFGLNRSTVREGLRELEIAGLIGRGPKGKRFHIIRPKAAQIATGTSRAMALNDVRFQDVWEAMMALEPFAAELAADRASEAQLADLQQSVTELRDNVENQDAIVEGAVRFFRLLADATGNQVIALSQEPLCQLLRPSLHQMTDKLDQAGERILAAQENIVALLKARKAHDAKEWMVRHIMDYQRGYVLAGIEMEDIVLG